MSSPANGTPIRVGEVCLHDNRAQLTVPAAGAFTLAALLAVFAATDTRHWYLFVVSGFAGLIGAVLAPIAIMNPRRLTLSRDGLTLKTRRAVESIPAAAVQALGVTRVARLHFITLWYDTAQVPRLPPNLAFYVKHQAPCGDGKIYLACVGPPLKEEKIGAIYRLVQRESLGEWRDYPADVGSDG
jgi:hypothetical protein